MYKAISGNAKSSANGKPDAAPNRTVQVALSVIGALVMIYLIATTMSNQRCGTAQLVGMKASSASAPEGTTLSLSQRQALSPIFMECIHRPEFKAGDASGTCQVLHEPSTNPYKNPLPAFRQTDKVSIDVTRCKPMVDAIAPENEMTAALDPFEVNLRPGSTDHDVFLQIYCGDDFHFITTLATFMPVDRPLTFLDAGSNIGMASVLFAHMIMGNGQVVAVDANPDTFKVMTSNTEFNSAITPVYSAIVDGPTSREKESLTFSGKKNDWWGFRIDHEGNEDAETVTYEVPTKSLAALRDMTKAKKFDLIKLDIEGEEKFLMDDPESKAVLCDAVCVFMELHERFEPGCEANFAEFMKTGCEGTQFQEVIRSGEYYVICKTQDKNWSSGA